MSNQPSPHEQLDRMMDALGSLTTAETLTILLDISTHILLDDIRIQVTLAPNIVTEKRLTSKALLPLVETLQSAGFHTPGFVGETDIDYDDTPIPFLPTRDGDDEPGMFWLGDES